MALIAGVSFNVVIGTIMGSFSLMIASVETRLHVSTGAAAGGLFLMLLVASLLAPFVGVLIARYSLRMLMVLGAVLTVAGFLILALTTSYPLYLAAYGLCFGPAMILTGSIGPNTLVARWFGRNRGLALGLVNLPFLIAILPVLLNAFLDHYSVRTAYLVLAAIAGLIMLPLNLLIRDHPPGGEAAVPGAHTADGSYSLMQLLGKSQFWALCLAAIASMTSSVLLGALLIPMGTSWGFTRGESSIIQSVMSMVGLAGSVLFGWVADRLGGGKSLALIGLNCAILWAVLLLHPSFTVALVVIGLIGLHGSGAMPTLGRGLSDSFGKASYSRGLGLNTLFSLPFMGAAMLGAPIAYARTGSYNPSIAAMACYFALAVGLGLYGARKPR